MNHQLQFRFAVDRHQQLLQEAETERKTCCAPKPIKVSLPRLNLFTAAPSACTAC